MRQAGILAAAGLYALENNVERLAEDHRNAKLFARELAGAPGVLLDPEDIETNIIWFSLDEDGPDAATVAQRAADGGVLVSALGRRAVRAVTHLNVDEEAVRTAARTLRETLQAMAA